MAHCQLQSKDPGYCRFLQAGHWQRPQPAPFSHCHKGKAQSNPTTFPGLVNRSYWFWGVAADVSEAKEQHTMDGGRGEQRRQLGECGTEIGGPTLQTTTIVNMVLFRKKYLYG